MTKFVIPDWYNQNYSSHYVEGVAFIYGVECGGFLKIGFARNPARRLKDIQAHNPLPCKMTIKRRVHLMGVFYAERYLHSIFATRRTHGEWFAVSTKEVQPYVRLAVNRAETAAKACWLISLGSLHSERELAQDFRFVEKFDPKKYQIGYGNQWLKDLEKQDRFFPRVGAECPADADTPDDGGSQ